MSGDRAGSSGWAARELVAVGYFVFRTPAWDEWMTFAESVIRAHIEVQPPGDWVRLRIDGKIQRIVLEKVDGQPAFAVGLQARDEANLQRLAARLRAENLTLHPGTDEECRRRGVDRFFWFTDPDGNRLEAFIGLGDVDAPLKTSLPIGGFRTQDLGVGHIVIETPRFEQMSDFYRGLLRLSLSDFCLEPFRAEFMHLNPRHHSLALIAGTHARIHHIMLEYLDWDDVGRAYDVVLRNPESIGQTLGRHSNDLMTSFYVFGPDRFMIELGWAGRLVGEDWRPEELIGPSLWGHERNWLPPEKRELARQLRAKYASLGVRQPVDIPETSRSNSHD